MRRLPPFTLVHEPAALRSERSERRPQLSHLPELEKRWSSLDRALQQTLLASAASVDPDSADEALITMLSELNRQNDVVTVGVWELDANVGFLPGVIERLNQAQPVLTFFIVEAAVPAGLVSRPSRVLEWLREEKAEIKEEDLKDLKANIIANDFLPRARTIRQETGLSMIVGVSARQIAFSDAGGIWWNHFAYGDDKLALISTDELRDFATRAGRKFENAVAGVMVCAVLAELSPDLDFHPESHGTPCVFDYNEDRVSIVEVIRSPAIHPDCLAKIPKRYRKAAKALIATLASDSHGRGNG